MGWGKGDPWRSTGRHGVRNLPFSKLHLHLEESWILFSLSSPSCLLFSFYVHYLSEAIGFRIWVQFSVSLLLCYLPQKRTGERTEREVHEASKNWGNGGGVRVWGSDRDGESQRVRWRCTFFFVMTASSICCLLLLLTSLISFFHHQPSPFTYWAVLPLICPSTGLWSILHLSANDRLLIDERAGQIKQLGQVAGKETERHVFFR